MNIPDLSKTYETFILIPIYQEQTIIFNWNQYIKLMYDKAIPLIDNLLVDNIIDWYSFLIHNKTNGVPTSEDDNNFYIHLRLEVVKSNSEEDFYRYLPEYCVMTRKMPGPYPHPMSGIYPKKLKNEDIGEAWKILGECSELMINILKSHENIDSFPIEHVSQFLHFLGNQFLSNWIGIPMP